MLPSLPRHPTGNKRVEIEDFCIPRELRSYAPNLSILSSLWGPAQAMVNLFTNEIAREADVVPAYFPYTVPDLPKGYWAPNETSLGNGHFLPATLFSPNRNAHSHRGRMECGV